MDLTLTELETAALAEEGQAGESLDQVIHRLIAPLVERFITTRFDAMLDGYRQLSLADRAALLPLLEGLAEQTTKRSVVSKAVVL